MKFRMLIATALLAGMAMICSPLPANAQTTAPAATAQSALDTITQTAQAVKQTADAVATASNNDAGVTKITNQVSAWANVILIFGLIFQGIFGKKQLTSVANNATSQMQLMAANHSVAVQSINTNNAALIQKIATEHTAQINTLATAATPQQ